MQLPITSLRTIRPGLVAWMTALALIAAFLAGCGATPSSSTPGEATPEPSLTQPNVASPTAAVSASAAAEICLPAEIIAAIEEISDGNFEPAVPLSEIADAVEPLDVSGLDDPSFAELLRDDLVEKLREPNPEFLAPLGFAATGFLSEVEIAEC